MSPERDPLRSRYAPRTFTRKGSALLLSPRLHRARHPWPYRSDPERQRAPFGSVHSFGPKGNRLLDGP